MTTSLRNRIIGAMALGLAALTLAACEPPAPAEAPETYEPPAEAPVEPPVEPAPAEPAPPPADATALPPDERTSEDSVRPESETLFY